jgi:hypothetical protein
VATRSALLAAGLLAWGGSARAGEYVLAFVASREARFEWQLFDPAEGSTRSWLLLDAPPEAAFFDAREPAVYFALGGEVRRAPLDADGKSSRVADRPQAAGGRLEALWIEDPGGRLRALVVSELDEAAVEGEAGEARYRLPDGTRVPAADAPPWGDPVVCTFVELRADGAWETLERVGTRGGAADAPGCAAVTHLRHERGHSLPGLLASYRCGDDGCHAEAPEPLPSGLADAWRSVAEVQTVRSLAAPSGGRLYFGAGLGDTWHAFAPLWLARPGAAPEKLALDLDGQLQLAPRGVWVLVAREFSGEDPRVVDLRTGRVVFSGEGSSAAWLPLRPRKP